MRDAAPRPPDLLPILVGVTGKRQFDPADPVRNAALTKVFAARFRTLVQELDRCFPDMPKVLVCGAAAGTDLAAVRVALEADDTGPAHPAWSVVLMLPLERELFVQDFEDPAFAQDREYLAGLPGMDPRIIVKQLRPLLAAPFDDALPEPPGLPRVPRDHLDKDGPTGGRPARAEHFEQLGIWLARYATILVAAGPAETADPAAGAGLGGTARVVACRRATPDPAAEAVIRRSSELLGNPLFQEPDGGYVLWIDPTAAAPDSGLPGAQVLRPIGCITDPRDVEASATEARARIYARPMHDPPPSSRRARYTRGREALAIAATLQRIHHRRGARRNLSPETGPEND